MSIDRDTVIAEAVRATWGADARVEAYLPISRRAGVVARLRLANAAPATVIVKHHGGVPNTEFHEELAAQRLLREIGAEKDVKPRLLGWTGHAFFLEDLGEENFARPRTYGELLPMLAAPLARLHTAARPHLARYAALREELGLREDVRRYGTPAEARRFELGCAHFADRARRNALQLVRELDRAGALVDAPGPFTTLIHDDLGNARQTFEVGDAILLLDFEYAKSGHALRDFVKMIVGKYEDDLEHGVYTWTQPRFPRAIFDVYRSLLPQAFDDALWREHCDAVLIYGTMLLVGRLMHLEPEVKLLGTVVQNINGLLYQLERLLGEQTPFPAVRAAIRHMLDLDSATVRELESVTFSRAKALE